MALHMNIIFQVVLPEKWSKQYLELQLLQAPNQSPLMYRLVSEEALKLSISVLSLVGVIRQLPTLSSS